MNFASHGPSSAPRAPLPTSQAFLRKTLASDIDQHVEQLQDWEMNYDQLDCGRFAGRFTDIRWPGVQLFVEKTTRRIRQRGRLIDDSISVATMIEGQGDIAVNGIRAGAASLLACDSSEIDICTPTDCTMAGIVVDSRVLRSVAEAQGVPVTFDPGQLVSMTPPEPMMQQWRDTLVGTATTLTERPDLLADERALERLQQDLLGSLVQAMAGAHGLEGIVRPDQRKRIVDRACELLLSRADDPPTLAEVCHRVGASPRKLAYCFQDILGVSPARYVKAIRLNAVRRELARAQRSADSVYDVAARWGFWHFGHFSADYKKQFAELPSETLRRAREQVAA
jgi:AraC family ethanolamine operon transcriptional activator